MTDLVRSKARGKLMDKIRSSVAAGGTNQTTNLKLSGLLAQAKSMEVPKASIESALKAAPSTCISVREAVMYERRGASGFLILIETLTDNRKRTRPEIRHILEKQGYVCSVVFLCTAFWGIPSSDTNYFYFYFARIIACDLHTPTQTKVCRDT